MLANEKRKDRNHKMRWKEDEKKKEERGERERKKDRWMD